MSFLMFAVTVLSTTAILMLTWFVIYGLVYLSGNLIIEGAEKPITKAKLLEVLGGCFLGALAVTIALAIS